MGWLIAMGRIVERPPIKLRSSIANQGLRKLSPDLISKARDETATQVTRVGLTFLGTTAFCLLSLLSPDSALVGGSERINVPLAGPVSFFGFMLLGPAVLILLRIYLQIYVEHGDRLDRLSRSVPLMRAPTLVPLQNPLMRFFSALIFYLLLPVTMLLFAWKAAVFPAWGTALSAVAAAVILGHVMLPLSRFTWRSKALLSVTAGIVAGVIILGFGPPHRPFDLFRAKLSGEWLDKYDLRKANLRLANLSDAQLSNANLSGANLIAATLSRARLYRTNLSGAEMGNVDLRDARLYAANLTGANVGSANLSGADLIYAKLNDAQFNNTNLSGADLISANLSGAYLVIADLSRANLSGAILSGARLTSTELNNARLDGADLSGAKDLTQTQLDQACGNEKTKLPEGLTLKHCEPFAQRPPPEAD
jgi:uncharacterized protein YjbI with pentapeptide repeats